jgi:hypothetical protein
MKSNNSKLKNIIKFEPIAILIMVILFNLTAWAGIIYFLIWVSKNAGILH